MKKTVDIKITIEIENQDFDVTEDIMDCAHTIADSVRKNKSVDESAEMYSRFGDSMGKLNYQVRIKK